MNTTAAIEFLKEANARIDLMQAKMANARKRAEATDCPEEKAAIVKEIHQILEELDRHQANYLRCGGPAVMRAENNGLNARIGKVTERKEVEQ